MQRRCDPASGSWRTARSLPRAEAASETQETLSTLPTVPGFCPPRASPLRRRQEKYRSGRTTAQVFGSSSLTLRYVSDRLRPTRGTAL